MLTPLTIGNITLNSPVVLAPMAGVTDLAYRLICRELGCGLVVTEMISAKGLYYKDSKTKDLLKTVKEESPAAIQIFGSDETVMAWAADKLNEMPHQILDINMGCPTPKIVRNGDGSALMLEPEKAGRIVKAVVKASMKPVTVKIRKGWDDGSVNAVEMAKIIEENGAAAVAVHGRTREQYYTGKADWDIIRQVKDVLKIPVIGNGDLFSADHVSAMFQETGCDGVMIARGAQGNPWLFRDIRNLAEGSAPLGKPAGREVFDVLKKHLQLAVAFKGEHIAVKEMRKHAAWYTKGFSGSAAIRQRINGLDSADEVLDTLASFLL